MNWIADYEKILLAGDLTEAKDFKNLFFPKKLFKYRALNEYTLRMLFDESVWMGNASTMNDPYESALKLDLDSLSASQMSSSSFWELKRQDYAKLGVDEKVIDQIQNAENPLKEEISILRKLTADPKGFDNLIVDLNEKLKLSLADQTVEFIRHIQKIVRFCAFSERNDSLLMWSHYSDQHQGICFEYELGTTEFLKNNTHPVIYSSGIFDATSHFLNKGQIWQISLLSSLYKAIDWQYEKEWRLTMPNKLLETDRLFKIGTPTAIYFGSEIDRINDVTKKEILHQICSFAEMNNIPKYKMKLDRLKYEMVPDLF